MYFFYKLQLLTGVSGCEKTKDNMFIVRWILKAINILCALALAVAFICPHFSPQTLPYISTVGFVVPFLIIVNIFFVILWAVRLNIFVLYSVFALLVGIGQLGHFFAIGSSSKPDGADTLRIVSYNVHGFSYKKGKGDNPAEKIHREIVKYAPDIVCFQEYAPRKISLPELKYSYVQNHGWFGDAIFSRYPIVGRGTLNFQRTQNNAIYADILLPDKRIVRVYSVHLQSLGITADEVNELASLSSDKLKSRAKGLLWRINSGFVRQQAQVEAVRASMDRSPYPCIVGGDFNNTPFSYSFLKLEGDNMDDAFAKAGFGFGKTFREIKLYPLRIDFILSDKEAFKVNRFSTIHSDASDHNGITALLSLKDVKEKQEEQ